MIASPHGPRCVAVDAVALEITRHIPRLAAQRRLDPAPLFAALQVMPVEWKPAADYDSQREEAQRRIAARDPDDWPTVALALTLGLPVWSQDKDLTAAGLDVLTTGELVDALRDAGHIDHRWRHAAGQRVRSTGSRELAGPSARSARGHW